MKAIRAEAYNKCMEDWIKRCQAYIGSGAHFVGDKKNIFIKINGNVVFLFCQFGLNLIRWY